MKLHFTLGYLSKYLISVVSYLLLNARKYETSVISVDLTFVLLKDPNLISASI